MRKLVAILVLLVIGSAVSVAGAATIKTNINFVGPGTVANNMFVINGNGVIASEESVVSSPFMTYTQTSMSDLSGIISNNVLKVSSTKGIKFSSEMYSSNYFQSWCSVNAVNGSVTYQASLNHIARNYTRNVVVSAEQASLISDFERSNVAEHDFTAKGTMYDVYFNSSTSMLNVSGNESITGSICFNVPSYNVSGVPSFSGSLTDYIQLPEISNVSVGIYLQSFNTNNTVSITKSMNSTLHILTQSVDVSGVFNTLNNTTTFFSESVYASVPSSLFP